jgi:3-phenylpropionate/cinnamic acid dioxygenase small subunit
MTTTETGPRRSRRAEIGPDQPLYGAVQKLLFEEADLLDEYRFADWFELFSEDVVYKMPTRTTRFLRDGKGFSEMSFFDENHASLQTRVKRLETEFAWAEAPPSRTRHFVTNIRVFPTDTPDEFEVKSNFMVTRTRNDLDYQLLAGVRHDRVRRAGEELSICRREILVDQTVITSTNLSMLF